MSSLLPDGITHLGDCPFTVHHAILFALRVLAWEEFPLEERPPKRIWLDNEKLNAWWKKVEADRKEKYGAKQPDEGSADENAVELITRG